MAEGASVRESSGREQPGTPVACVCHVVSHWVGGGGRACWQPPRCGLVLGKQRAKQAGTRHSCVSVFTCSPWPWAPGANGLEAVPAHLRLHSCFSPALHAHLCQQNSGGSKGQKPHPNQL